MAVYHYRNRKAYLKHLCQQENLWTTLAKGIENDFFFARYDFSQRTCHYAYVSRHLTFTFHCNSATDEMATFTYCIRDFYSSLLMADKPVRSKKSNHNMLQNTYYDILSRRILNYQLMKEIGWGVSVKHNKKLLINYCISMYYQETYFDPLAGSSSGRGITEVVQKSYG
jgi:hypothetical protein